MVAIATTFVGTATAVLALASSRNIWQAFSLCRAHSNHVHRSSAFLSLFEDVDVSDEDQVLTTLQSLPRRDLIKLFLSSTAPSNVQDIQGEWNGILLKNNAVLTTVTGFLTNGLFGKGRKWNGKAFNDNLLGANRFHSNSESEQSEKEHRFDYSIAMSKLDPSSSCVNLNYSNYQSLLSLWKTMVDELRVLPLSEECPIEVLICMGCMGWSGGMLNASPFCLWRYRYHKVNQNE